MNITLPRSYSKRKQMKFQKKKKWKNEHVITEGTEWYLPHHHGHEISLLHVRLQHPNKIFVDLHHRNITWNCPYSNNMQIMYCELALNAVTFHDSSKFKLRNPTNWKVFEFWICKHFKFSKKSNDILSIHIW